MQGLHQQTSENSKGPNYKGSFFLHEKNALNIKKKKVSIKNVFAAPMRSLIQFYSPVFQQTLENMKPGNYV